MTDVVFRPKHAKPDTIERGRDYTDEEFEFLKACEEYRTEIRASCLDATDYLYVIKKLGYKKKR